MTRRPPADRMRAYRARVRAGRIVLPIEVAEVEIAQELVDARLLRPDQVDDRQALAHAIARFLDLCSGVTPDNRGS